MEDKNQLPEENPEKKDITPDDVQNQKDAELTENENNVLESQTESEPDTDEETEKGLDQGEKVETTAESGSSEDLDSKSDESESEETEKIEERKVSETENEAKAEESKATESEVKVDKAEKTDEPAENVSEDSPDNQEQAEEDDSEEEEVDFESFSKKQLTEYLVELKNEANMRKVDKVLKDIRPFFDEIYNTEKEAALKGYMEGTEDADEADFEYKGDEWDQKFFDYYDLLKSKRNDYFSNLEKSKEDNLKKKQEILDKIRELVDGEETNVSIKAIKDLQEEWRNTGPVPSIHNKTLWANYNALLDRYYDARSIYFELKELDRKKNLESKLELVEKAEALDKYENIKDAIKELNELHEEFKHIGPVPREEQEALWLKFKAASDKIYVKRKDFTEKLKHDLQENLVKKDSLGEEVKAFVDFDSDRINEWNAKTKEILELQKKWEAIGGLPRDKAKEVNRKFWNSFKKFFSNKNAFFKTLESKREENLELKKKLVEQANELKTQTEWDKTAEQLKKLQQEWRNIGPVPEKFKNEIYQEFKAACDYFFDQRRAQNKEQNKEFENNLKAKMDLCEQLEELAAKDSLDIDEVYDLVDQYSEIGFVPRNVIKKSKTRFDEVCKKLVKHPSLDEDESNDLRMNMQVNKLKGSPHGNRKLHRKENALRRKINTLESDINTWKTNVEFFASSKTADALKDEFTDKIEKASEELEELKKQLEILHQA